MSFDSLRLIKYNSVHISDTENPLLEGLPNGASAGIGHFFEAYTSSGHTRRSIFSMLRRWNSPGSERICLRNVQEGILPCRKRSALRSANVRAKLYPCWESPGLLWRQRRAERSRLSRLGIYRRRTRYRLRLFSVKRKSPTSAWRRSISSTRRSLEP